MSVSNDLKVDAERDLSDIGAGRIEVHALNKVLHLHPKKEKLLLTLSHKYTDKSDKFWSASFH